MNFTPLDIPGAFLFSLESQHDERGHFTRLFSQPELVSQHLDFTINQINHSFTRKKGSIRGLHFQLPPFQETKIVQCLNGRVFDVIVDLRLDSPTFGTSTSVELDAAVSTQVYIPAGCAHGFQCLTDNVLLQYFMSTPYKPESAQGLRWNDSQFEIKWPLSLTQISTRDTQWPLFDGRSDFRAYKEPLQ